MGRQCDSMRLIKPLHHFPKPIIKKLQCRISNSGRNTAVKGFRDPAGLEPLDTAEVADAIKLLKNREQWNDSDSVRR